MLFYNMSTYISVYIQTGSNRQNPQFLNITKTWGYGVIYANATVGDRF
jgi:hypothetical protein